MPKDVPISKKVLDRTVGIRRDQLKFLEQYSKKIGKSKSEIIRDLIDAKIRNIKRNKLRDEKIYGDTID